jgi:DNA-binding beta-propeller fold protein YncE
MPEAERETMRESSSSWRSGTDFRALLQQLSFLVRFPCPKRNHRPPLATPALLAATLILTAFGTKTRADTLFVTDSVDNTIYELNSSGQRTIFASGLDSTGPIAFGSNGNLYMADWYDGTILKFNSSGQYTVFATSGVNQPQAMAFDSQGNLYVANTGNGTVEKFNSAGQGTVFASGLYGPCGLAFAGGNLFVADEGGQIGAYEVGNNIMKFDMSGNGSVFAANVWPAIGGNLAFDSSGSLYLGDSENTILRFDSSGNSTVFANEGGGTPRGLAFDSSGDLYMPDFGNSTVLEFDSSGNASVFGAVKDADWIAVEPIPEPATCALSAMGFLLLLFYRFRPSDFSDSKLTGFPQQQPDP